ncbi:hypothetical protein HRG_013257 [Hirsutella rhossiliensis]
MSSSSPLPPPHLRRPLDSQRGAGGEMSMMFFVQPDCPSRFAHQDEHRIRGLNAETMARVFLPPPSWLLTAEYAPLRSDTDDSATSIFFSLNLSIYNQPVVASEWTEEWFFMNGRVHPYALAWEVEQRDGLESGAGGILLYTMPALIIRDQGYQPVLPRLFASMDSFPRIPPIVSFTGLIVGPGHSLLRQDLLPGLDATQLRCCGFLQLSTYITPGIPDKIPLRGFHPFQVFVIFPIRANPWAILCKKMAERRDSQFQTNISFTCTGKVAGLLDHRVMVHQPSSDRDYVFIVVPDSWTFSTRPPPPQPRCPRCLFLCRYTWRPPAESSAFGFDFGFGRSRYTAAEASLSRARRHANEETAPVAAGLKIFLIGRHWKLCHSIVLAFRCLFFLRAGDDETESCLGNRLGTRR